MSSVQPRSPDTSMLCRVCVRVLTREAYGNCRRVVKLQSLQETLYDGWVFLRDVILLQGILHYVKQPQVLFVSSFLTGNKPECFVVAFFLLPYVEKPNDETSSTLSIAGHHLYQSCILSTVLLFTLRHVQYIVNLNGLYLCKKNLAVAEWLVRRTP